MRSSGASCRWLTTSPDATAAQAMPSTISPRSPRSGLLKAIDRFDPSRGAAFSSFATPTIVGELKRHFRDTSWAVHVPRPLQELAHDVLRVVEVLERELGRPPTTAEIAVRAGVRSKDVLEAFQVLQARHGVSLDGLQHDGEGRGRTGWIEVTDDGFGRVEDAATLKELMSELSELDREVLRLRFADDLTQVDIAARVGVTQMQVSRLIRSATTRLSESPGAWTLREDRRAA